MIPETPETYGGIFAVPEITKTDAPTVTLRAIAAALVEPGTDPDFLFERIRGYVRHGLIHPAARVSGAFVFRPEAALVAGTLHQAATFGLVGTDPMRAEALASNAFNAADLGVSEADIRSGKAPPKNSPRSPAAWAMAQFLGGTAGFVFQLATIHHPESRHRFWRGRVFNTEHEAGPNLHIPSGYVLRALLAVPLDPIMARLFRGPRE
jgi:hypothetical protein